MPRNFNTHTVPDVGIKHAVVSKQRREFAKLYNTKKWREARLEYLKRNPLCVRHLKQNKNVAANVVDHDKPHKGDIKLFWDKDNWQSLCIPCHNTKTALEDGGFGRTHQEK